jgi:hypothetical protein
MDFATKMLLGALTANALAAGATADQAVKQLPARHRIGSLAYAQYARAADLGTGLVWYPPLGLGAAATTLAAATIGLRRHPSSTHRAALIAATVGTLAHIASTARAAPTLLTLRHGDLDPDHTRDVLDRFARLNALRLTAMASTLIATGVAVGTAH